MRKISMATMIALGTMIGATSALAQTTPVPAPAPTPSGPTTSPRDPFLGMQSGTTRARTDDLVYDNKTASTNYGDALAVARCVVSVSAKRAPSLIGGPGTSDPTYDRLNSAMTMRLRTCVRDSRGMIVPMLLSAAVAEQLMRSETGPFEDRAKSVDVDAAAKFHGDLGKEITLDGVGRCQAVYSPGLAYKVLGTGPGSAEETAALDTLYAKTFECGPTEAPSNIPHSYQRAAVAQGLYLWTHKSG